jgi:GH24 family phage-related lysozyme (muramidase)
MWPSVVTNWVKFNQNLEGVLPYMYLDILGYVTTGMGNLIDPVSEALALPWLTPAGTLASSAEVIAAWNTVDALRSDPKGQKQTSGPATHYGQAFAQYTTIRLNAAGIQQAIATTLAADEAVVKTYYPKWAVWPADGQATVMSMAWAMGASSTVFPGAFHQFNAAVNAGDFQGAIAYAGFKGTGVGPRIAQDKVCLANAQQVINQGLDPSVLYWPKQLSPGPTPPPPPHPRPILAPPSPSGLVALLGLTIIGATAWGTIRYANGKPILPAFT